MLGTLPRALRAFSSDTDTIFDSSSANSVPSFTLLNSSSLWMDFNLCIEFSRATPICAFVEPPGGVQLFKLPLHLRLQLTTLLEVGIRERVLHRRDQDDGR